MPIALSRLKPWQVFVLNLFAFIAAYYIDIVLHEWGHGTTAWLYGLKRTPFAVDYGGWALLHVDEAVNYNQLLATGRGVAAALIAISGLTVTVLLSILSFTALNLKRFARHPIILALAYWMLIINMLAMIQYFTLSVFSPMGDTGRFVHGLNISAWWIFVPGTIIMIILLYRLLHTETIKMFVLLPLKSRLGQSAFLLATLVVLFLTLYTHSYNPIADNKGIWMDQILAIISILLVPILFLICLPYRSWVQRRLSIILSTMNS